MAAFRRCLIALAVLAIFAGLASAQTQPMTCSLSALNTTARAESKSELMSDLLITCTGGTVNTTNTVTAPTVNLTLTMPQAITSRILSTSGGNQLSEALLLIDDPGTSATPIIPALAGFGNNAAPAPCLLAPNGCNAFPNVVSGIAVMSATAAPLGSPTTGAANTYQGVVSGNAVTFFGVPVIPPGTTASRTYRITNVRVNTSAGSSGSLVGSIAVQGGAAPLFTFNNTQATLATVQSGMKPTVTGTSNSNCAPLNYAFAGTVSFAENFASGFRTRILAGANGGPNTTNTAQSNAIIQNVPGTYFSESGYETAAFTGGVAGLADFGTRLKAVFNNIPSGVRVFVSFANVFGSNTAVPGNMTNTIWNTPAVGTNNTTTLAELISGAENSADTNTGAPVATPSVSTTALGSIPAGEPYVELTVSGGSATAVWEVLNTNTAANETIRFDVFIITQAQQATGTATANASYAPTLTSTTIPSFLDPNASSPQNSFTITQCKTTLLFPFVTSAAGFDTGMAVSNTSSDTFGTTAQTGTCQFTLYGTPTPIPTVPVSPSIASGTSYAFTLSSVAPGFTGYAIAVCNFQFAHGFVYVANWTSPTVSSAMGYLALVMPYTSAGGRAAAAGNGEGLIH